MTNNKRVLYGLLITILVFVVSTYLGQIVNLNIEFFPQSFFVTHTVMLITSAVAIFSLKKHVNFRIALPKFRKILRPILFGLLATIAINIFITVLGMSLGGKVESHVAVSTLSPWQFFVFVFVYASIAEEILFRGFLQNILSPLEAKVIRVFRRHISVPVLISATVFGLAHLILVTTGASGFFLVRIVIFTTVLGIIAGYYQEKYENNAYAIIVHMAGNFMGLLGVLMMSLNPQV